MSSDIGTPGGKLSTMQPTLAQWLSPYVVTRKNWPKVDMAASATSSSKDEESKPFGARHDEASRTR